MELKPATTYEEQLEILIGRGVTVDNREYALKVLSNINYYVLSGYFHEFRVDAGGYESSTSFNNVVRIYNFDNKFRRILLDAISVVEHSLKTKIAYQLAHNEYKDVYIFGNACFFKDDTIRADTEELFLNIMKREKALDNVFVNHHFNHYDGKMPIWVSIELLTLGNIARLFKNLKKDYRHKVADDFGVEAYILQSWLFSLRDVRNKLAHQMRLYNVRNYDRPKKCTHDKEEPHSGFIYDQVFFIIKNIYFDENMWQEALDDLGTLFAEYEDVVDPRKVGFSSDWKERLSK